MWCAPELLSAVTTFTTDKDFILQHGISVSGSLRKLHPPFPIMSQKKTMAPIQIKNTSPKKNIPSLKISVPLIGWVGPKISGRGFVRSSPEGLLLMPVRMLGTARLELLAFCQHSWGCLKGDSSFYEDERRSVMLIIHVYIYDICIIQINVKIYIYVSM